MPRPTHRSMEEQTPFPDTGARKTRAQLRHAEMKRMKRQINKLLRSLDDLNKIDARHSRIEELVERTLENNRGRKATIGELFTPDQIKEIDAMLKDRGISLADYAAQRGSPAPSTSTSSN